MAFQQNPPIPVRAVPIVRNQTQNQVLGDRDLTLDIGWCEKNQAYRDFVLSRFRGEPEIMDQSEHGIEGDTEWNLKITIRIAADPRLTVAQREVVEVDYGMQNGVLEIPTRARLVTYVLQLLNIKPATIADDPTAQQIVVQNASASDSCYRVFI